MRAVEGMGVVAAWTERVVVMGPVVAVKAPVAGLYSSALLRKPLLLLYPPAISTMPLLSSVALCPYPRAVVMAPVVGVKVPVAGLYSSALARSPLVPL